MVEQFIAKRIAERRIQCDNCRFDPARLIANTAVKARSLLDLHHVNPLAAGERETKISDLCLLCPTCHRFLHRLADTLSDPTAKAQALRPRSI
jgi:5-methylcytosine-specific restriction protein A